jgi:hypothetical protein
MWTCICLAFAQATKPEPLVYPTFEPFTASRMSVMFGDPKQANLEDLASRLEMTALAMARGKEAGLEFAPPSDSKLDASLRPHVAGATEVVAALVPLALMRLQPLWTTPAWSDAEVADASAAIEILSRLDGAPRPAFEKGEHARNRAGMEELVRWFDAQVAKPELYASMLFTLDDGPFFGLPSESAEVLPAIESVQLDHLTALALCRVERPNEPWVLQAVRGGKPLWTRVLSAAPDESLERRASRAPARGAWAATDGRSRWP